MATTATYSGSLNINAQANAALSVDQLGSSYVQDLISITFAASGGTAPTISGFFRGVAVCAAGDWLLAHATDPLQSMGDATYSTGFTVASSKLKLLLVQNLDSTNTITIIQGAINGLTIFDAASHGVKIGPGGIWLFYDKAGSLSGALTTGSNDKLTISVSAGSPNAQVSCYYGP